MSVVVLLDAAGRPRSPATLPGHRAGCAPRNKGRQIREWRRFIAVMRIAGPGIQGDR
jgi:hypothetical protein